MGFERLEDRTLLYTLVNVSFSIGQRGTLNANVLANDSGVPSVEVLDSPDHGQLTLHADGTFTYSPAAGFVGEDTFVYGLPGTSYEGGAGGGEGGGGSGGGSGSGSGTGGTGGGGGTSGSEEWATVTITVSGGSGTGLNLLPPLAADDGTAEAPRWSIRHDQVLDITGQGVGSGVLGNDTDPDGNWLTASVASGPSRGMLTLHNDGTFEYIPEAGYVGVDSFEYTVFDGQFSATATAYIDVQPDPWIYGSVGITTAYGDSFSIGDGKLVPSAGGTFIYAGSVPFLVTANFESEVPVSVALHVWAVSSGLPGPYEQVFWLSPGSECSTVLTLPIGLASEVVLAAELISPYTAEAFAYAECDEGVVETGRTLKSFTDELDFDASDVTEFFGKGTDQLAEQLLGNLFTPEQRLQNEQQYEVTPAALQGRIDALESLFKALLRNTTAAAVNRVFGADDPEWMLRIGASDPGLGAVNEFWDGTGEAGNAGMARLLDGAALLENLDRFVEIDWASPGSIFLDSGLLSELGNFIQTGDADPLEEILKSVVVVDSVTLNIPLVYDNDDPLFNRSLVVKAKGISMSNVRGVEIGGRLSIDHLLQRWGINVNSAYLEGTVTSLLGSDPDYDVQLRFDLSR